MTESLQGVSVRLAAAMNRRRFIRRAAAGTFAGLASLAAGRLISPATAFGYASACDGPQGHGCPFGCGPSTCCSIRSGGCHCSNGAGGCQNGTAHCHGKANTWGGQSCWTCTHENCLSRCYYRVTTTCCDCATTGCGDSSGHCIAYHTTYTVLHGCPQCLASQTSGTVAGVATGNPATSWGIQPRLAP